MAANLEKLVEELSKLSVLEAADLVKLLEEKWGVSAAAPVAQLPQPVPLPPLLNPSKRRPNSMWSSRMLVPRRSRPSKSSAS
jgi:ribosomal protein L7/L12